MVHAAGFWPRAEARWGDNSWAIPLFAAFCEEGAHQDMVPLQAFTPYAVFRRGDPISVEVVGRALRPWLDGVVPEGASGAARVLDALVEL